MDIHRCPLLDNILVYITFFLSLIVGLCVAHLGSCHLCISCTGTANKKCSAEFVSKTQQSILLIIGLESNLQAICPF